MHATGVGDLIFRDAYFLLWALLRFLGPVVSILCDYRRLATTNQVRLCHRQQAREHTPTNLFRVFRHVTKPTTINLRGSSLLTTRVVVHRGELSHQHRHVPPDQHACNGSIVVHQVVQRNLSFQRGTTIRFLLTLDRSVIVSTFVEVGHFGSFRIDTNDPLRLDHGLHNVPVTPAVVGGRRLLRHRTPSFQGPGTLVLCDFVMAVSG